MIQYLPGNLSSAFSLFSNLREFTVTILFIEDDVCLSWLKSMECSLSCSPLSLSFLFTIVFLRREGSLFCVLTHRNPHISGSNIFTSHSWIHVMGFVDTLFSRRFNHALPLKTQQIKNLSKSRGMYVTRLYSQITPAHPQPAPSIRAKLQFA